MKPLGAVLAFALLPAHLAAEGPRELVQGPNTWVKRSPLPGGPRNPMLGYEASFGYDPIAKKIIRWAGHTQSGGHGDGLLGRVVAQRRHVRRRRRGRGVDDVLQDPLAAEDRRRAIRV